MDSMYSHDMWNMNKFNEGGIRKIESSGTVILNGMIDRDLCADADPECNPSPYYEWAEGKFREDYSVVRDGDFAYTLCDQSHSLEMLVGSSHSRQKSATVKCISSLNGQGKFPADTNWTLMSRIQPLGMVEFENDVSKRDFFNIRVGGVHTFRNNGNKVISIGNRVMFYLPSREELQAGEGAGAKKTSAERNNDVRPWLVPYDASIHSNQASAIWECLRDVTHKKAYMEPFRDHCSGFLDSIKAMSAVVIASIGFKKLKTLFNNNKTDDDMMEEYLQLVGHSKFNVTPGAPNSVAHTDAPKIQRAIRDNLFVPFSKNEKNQTPFLFPNPDQSAKATLQNKLNRLQASSTMQFIESSAYMKEFIERFVVGTAYSTGGPGDDFELGLNRYAY
jgi:hypothetical protein